jgi:hypothetical protein
LKRVKVLAAEEEKSVSQLIKEALEDRVHRRGVYERAKKRHLRRVVHERLGPRFYEWQLEQ